MIENHLLEQFIAVADNHTISGAAKKLHISQPAISHSMYKLEDEIGVPLFKRSSNRIDLNENGKVAVKYARLALVANEEVARQTQLFSKNNQILKIGACTTFIAKHFLARLQESRPNQKYQLTVANDFSLLDRLDDQSLDLAILHRRVTRPNLVYQHYVDDRLMLTVERNSPMAKRERLSFKDLTGQSVLGHQYATLWLDICRENIPSLNLITPDKITILEQLVSSSGLPTFNTLLARPLFKTPASKITLPIMDDNALVSYYFAYRKADQARFDRFFASPTPNWFAMKPSRERARYHLA